MDRKLRIAGYIFLGLSLGLGILVGALYVLTETRYGQERVRRFALEQVGERVEGELRVGRIESSGLLGGVVLHDVTFVDPLGLPFLSADSIRLRYRWRNLLRGQIVFDRLDAYRPEVYLTRLPGDTLWNFDRVFPDTTPDIDEENSFILIDRVTIVDGTLYVRTPWEPNGPDGAERVILEEIPGFGTVRVIRFEDINAQLPRVLWESPVEEGKLFQVAHLSTVGYIWDTPFRLNDLAGVVTVRDSLISFDVDRFRFPDSRGSGVGRIILDDENRYDILIDGDRVALADLQWLYPPLPDEGYGDLTFRIQSQPGGVLWLAQDAHIIAPGTELRGDFGIVTGDTLYFTQVDLRASPIDLELIASILPVDLPIDGLMVGTVVVEGPISSLTTRGDVRLASRGGGAPATLRWIGTVDFRPPYGLQNLDAWVDGLDLTLVPALRERLPVEGRWSGRVQATGRFDKAVRFAASVRHRVEGQPESGLQGSGTFTYASREASQFEAMIDAQTLALDALTQALPGLDRLRGEVHGPVRIHGPLSDLALEAELETSAGRIEATGRFDLTGARPRFLAEGRVADFRLDRLVEGLDTTMLTATLSLANDGDADGTRIRVDLDSGRVGPVDLGKGLARVRIEDGVARVDSLRVAGVAGWLEAVGSLGLDTARTGHLEIVAQVDSLSSLRQRLFGDAALLDEESIDSRIAGAVYLRASLRGALGDLEADGEARLEGVAYRTIELGRADFRFAARGAGTDSLRLRARGDASGAVVYGRPLDSAHATVEYAAGGGYVEFEARGAKPVLADYRVISEFRRDGSEIELDLREVRARDWIGEWQMLQPTKARFGAAGLTLGELQLARQDRSGRVRAFGRIPWQDSTTIGIDPGLSADFRLELRDVPISPLRLDESETLAHALASGVVAIAGTATEPVIHADLRLARPRYDDMVLERVDMRLAYRDRKLEGRIEAHLDGEAILVGQGRIPMDLSFVPVAERRLAEPLDFTFHANRVPAAFVTGLVEGFQDVRGDLTGQVRLGGTTRDPELGGEVTLRGGEATWSVSGVRYRNAEGNFTVLGDQVMALDLTARTEGGGTAHATGTLTFVPLSDPTFDITVTTREFQLSKRRDVAATGTGTVQLTGRFTEPRITGNIRIDRGELFLDEVWHQYNIVALSADDPLLFNVVDTSIVAMGQFRPSGSNAFTRNLVVQEFTIDVGRNTWLRGRTLDVEVAGRLQVDFDRRSEDIRLTGALGAIRGSYELYLEEDFPIRRFSVQQGVVEFDGTPGINPRLDIVAQHRVRTEGGTLNVEAVVTGNLRNPRVGFRSDANPPIAESDLLSLVLFGRPTTELARYDGANATGGSPLAGLLSGAGMGLAVPTFLGAASTGLESLAAELGLIDYLAITEWEGAATEDVDGIGSIFARSQVELGRYLGENWYVAVSSPLRTGQNALGVRMEWRFAPTWTSEFFWENRFLRGTSFGVDPMQQQRVHGFFLFREWGF